VTASGIALPRPLFFIASNKPTASSHRPAFSHALMAALYDTTFGFTPGGKSANSRLRLRTKSAA
jgi:hypothetical protein